MNDTFDYARLHQVELDREIDALQIERLVRSATPVRQGLPTRARAGLGRGLISLGIALVGRAGAAAPAARSAGSQNRA
jgi:hypothetical protein